MTTLNARVSRLVTPLGAFALLALGVPLATPSTAFGQEQVLYISATGVTGSPVSDLTAEEIVVQWDGEDTEIVELELIEWPVQVTMMVDNGRGGREHIDQIRAGLKAFIAALPEGVEMALVATSDEVLSVTDYTSDKAALTAGVDEMERGNDDAYFLDAMIAAAATVAAAEREFFPVFVNLATDKDEGSEGDQAAFEGMVNNVATNAGTVHTRLLYTEDGDADQSMQALVGPIGQQTPGGSYEAIADVTTLEANLTALAENIARKNGLVSVQYRVRYNPPANAGPAPNISVASTRVGLNLIPTIDGNLP
tara:strand:+ start:4466 stop:5392 length:927 start_codon:yes stop_codon:yes gene_type:complete